MRARSGTTQACCGLILVTLAGCYAANMDPPASAVDGTKIDAPLAMAAADLARSTPTSARIDAQGRLQIYAYVTDTSAATQDKLARAGLVGSQPNAEMAVIQGWIAPQDLPALAALSCVKRLTLPRYASTR